MRNLLVSPSFTGNFFRSTAEQFLFKLCREASPYSTSKDMVSEVDSDLAQESQEKINWCRRRLRKEVDVEEGWTTGGGTLCISFLISAICCVRAAISEEEEVIELDDSPL
ncbi:hypothetical protein Tco_1492627 [Tanacetum coccineum]